MNATSRAYEAALHSATQRVREGEPEADELTWQARWFSGACGREFRTADGRHVKVADFGEWNREAGPDFVQASVLLDGEEHRGAIEIDLDASGWEQHHHAINPTYENVILHVVVHRPARRHFARTATHREVPQVCLADHPGTEPEWESSARARPGRCIAPLRNLGPERLEELLATAARRRLERKARTLAAMMKARGEDHAIYEALSVSLGYKHNQLPFRLLAQRVPRASAATPRGEALLFGVAGFLERPEPPAGPARDEVSELWRNWWRQRASNVHAILPRKVWHLAGVRPANHPLRRVGALAVIARRWKSVRAALESGDAEVLQRTLGALTHKFWSFHTTFHGARRPKPLALLGAERIRDIHANVALPLAVARGVEPAWHHLPAGAPNATLRVVSARLFGGDFPAFLPRKLFVHQGLLQIHADFCLRDGGECAHCSFPGLVGKLST